jgi:hypothetical protein
LQDRVPKEFRLTGIDDVEAANRWLREHYVGEYNRAFAIAPEQEGSAFVPDRAEAWREILCIIGERTVGNDNTIAWAGRRLQLPESRLRPHFVKARVHVHEYPDSSVSVSVRTGWQATTATARCSAPRPLRAWQRARPRQGMAFIAPSAVTGRRHGHP